MTWREILGQTRRVTGTTRCPFSDHQDDNDSFSYHATKGVYNCFGCGKKGRLEKLHDDIERAGVPDRDWGRPNSIRVLDGSDSMESNAGLTKQEATKKTRELLRDRGLGKSVAFHILEVQAFGGYAPVFTSPDGVSVARNVGGVGPRFHQPEGTAKGLFYIGEPAPPGATLWVVEGVLDAHAMSAAGCKHVAACLGSELSDAMAYALRGRLPIFFFDRDAGGYKGLQRAREKCKEFDVHFMSREIPERMVYKDPGDWWANDRPGLKAFIEETMSSVEVDEKDYLRKTFYKSTLAVFPTPVETLNGFLGGGLKPGVHVLAAEPKVGKTSVISFFEMSLMRQGATVLHNTCEIPKSQQWARYAAQLKGAPAWTEIEADPSVLTDAHRRALERLASKVTVVAGWSVNRMLHELKRGKYDVLVVDYIQRLPENLGKDDDNNTARLSRSSALLSDASRDHGTISIVVSSVPRASYGTQEARPKGSGDIEFVCQSLSHLRTAGKGTLCWDLQYNTRGTPGIVMLEADLVNQRFKERRA